MILDLGGEFAFWSVKSRKVTRSFETDTGVDCFALSPDARFLVTGSRILNGNPRIWDSSTGKQTGELEGHPAKINSISFSPDGRWLAVGQGPGPLPVWKFADPKKPQWICETIGGVETVLITADGRKLGYAGAGGDIRLWSLENKKEETALRGLEGRVTALAASRDGRRWVGAAESNPLFRYLPEK